MSIQANTATTQNVEVKVETNTVAEKINSLVASLEKDDKGSWKLPEGTEVDETTAFAVMAERRRRDTQAAYTGVSQKVKALEAEKATLRSKAIDEASLQLTPELAEELDDLKFSNPEEWRKRMNVLETEHKTKRMNAIDEELKQVSTTTLVKNELEQREDILASFNASHSDYPISQEVIDNDIPPRILKKLETGKVTFEQFLAECYEYAKTGKVVKQTDAPEMPNIGRIPGGSKPDSKAVDKDIINSYKNETY